MSGLTNPVFDSFDTHNEHPDQVIFDDSMRDKTQEQIMIAHL